MVDEDRDTAEMAEALDPTLGKKEFHNWLKGALSVLFAKEGLSEFVQTEIIEFHTDLINSVITQNGISPGTTCTSCTTANILSCPTANFCSKGRRCNKHDKTVPAKTPNIQCRNNLCNGLKEGIRNLHRYIQPSWQNSDATKWCADALEMAKCFMPPDGYSSKRSLADTDFNGMIAMIINNKRFQNKMTTQLNTQYNVCSKARDIVNATIRHSGSNELSDLQLAQCIDALRDVLGDSKFLLKDQHAQAAVNKLNQLQNNTLTISAGDITRALEETIRDCLSQQHQEAVQAIEKYLNTAQTASVAALENIKSAALEEIRKTADDKKQELLLLSQQQQTHNDDILLDDAENKTSQLWRIWNKLTHKESRLRSNFKKDIITYYREHESVIPASPLVDEHNVPIEELYVVPPMWAYKNSYFEHSNSIEKEDQTSGNDGNEKQKISISQLFYGSDVRYKKIYITANAGLGKTSLSQKLTMAWCQSHSPLTSLTENYTGEELAAMKYFDLLFLLHLRDYQSEPKCNLDDMILRMVSEKLSRGSEYTQEFVQRILRKNKCLILLDSLDEWAHPGRCSRKPEVPHNNHPDSCTVLTTTRDWKIGTVGLSPKDIDRRVEIAMLDAKSRDLLEKNALGILNERKVNLAGKNIADFDKEVKRVQIGNIIYIPYILLQLMCLFFGGLSIGKSKCEIYSNITEFTLKRGLKKKGLPDMDVQQNYNAPVPNCMKLNKKCKLYFNLIMKLGKLAFCALFSEKKESSLIFDRKYAKTFMTKQEIEFCLKIGRLCQSKDNSIIAVKRYQVFFQHKSVQEFFSAIYITSEWQTESVKSTIVQFCSSLSSTLEMENLFVFVCGMNPEVYVCISGELQKIGDLDDVAWRYRMFVDNVKHTINSYQSMQMQCLQESMSNGNKSCPIYLYVVLDYVQDLKLFKTIIHFNKGHVKSLQISDSDEKNASMQSLDPGVFTYLETLRVEDCFKEPVWLADILTESARTLKCLTLSGHINTTALTGLACLQSLYLRYVDMTHSNLKYLYGYISQTTTLIQLKLVHITCMDHRSQYPDCDVVLNLHCLNELKMLDLHDVPCRKLNVNTACLTLSLRSLSGIKLTALTGLTCLQSLDLCYANMTHSYLQCLYACISQTTTLTRLKLMAIKCSDHQDQYRGCGVTLDLHPINELKMLQLDRIPFRELHVNTTCLEKLEFQPPQGGMTAIATATLWQDLRAAPALSSLTLNGMNSCQEMIQIIPTLTQLQYLQLKWTDMGMDVISISPVMKKLEHVELVSVTMSSAAWRKLVLSVDQLPRSINVKLQWIRMTWQEWRELLLSVGGLQHPVTMELYQCKGPSEEEWRTIVDVIKTTPTLSLLQDLRIHSAFFQLGIQPPECFAWLTLKSNPVL